jgi:murein L,D-transpeptidase YcbB/YkuD
MQSEPAKSEAATAEPLKAEPAKAAAEAAPAAPAKSEITSSVPAAPSSTETAASLANAATVEKLRDNLTGGKFDRLLGSKKERSSVEAFYASRDFAPLWTTDGAINERGKAAAAYLSGVDADGLEPSEYPVPQIAAGMEPLALAEAEIKFTSSVLTFARHAMGGRVHYTRVSGDIIYDLARPDPADLLGRLAKTTDVGGLLDSFNPPQPQYKALKAALAELRHGPLGGGVKSDEPKAEQHVRVPDGPTLRPGMSDPRVLAVRKRLKIADNADSPAYDDAVFDAVKAFQTEANIGVDGLLGPNTIRTMNGERQAERRRPAGDPIDLVLANMERWRWVPRDLGKT